MDQSLRTIRHPCFGSYCRISVQAPSARKSSSAIQGMTLRIRSNARYPKVLSKKLMTALIAVPWPPITTVFPAYLRRTASRAAAHLRCVCRRLSHPGRL